ncbi:hypothetical protein [Herbidospora yilanensis]|uniref:hypothetical protein n=1 Tax=Herbidospora yilanensis TaxID=354426 RepID=UPI0007805DE2|nr:hypothetical protein [Herbidospora yilanensis]
MVVIVPSLAMLVTQIVHYQLVGHLHAVEVPRQRWARRAKSSQVLAVRSKIVLACADGLHNIEIAAAHGSSGSG